MVSLKRKRSFKKELKYQIKTAIIVAAGFIVAYAWKEAIFRSAEKVVSRFSETTSYITNEILSAFLLTFLAVLLIFATSKLLRS